MFIGHYAPAFLAASTMRRIPGLGALFVAVQLLDIAFFTFLLLDIEHMRLVSGITGMNAMDLYDMPWTHSLAGALAWSGLFAFIVRMARGGWGDAAIGAGAVFSHWLIDFVVHRPDLTIAGGDRVFGLGLWNYPAIEIPLELILAYGGLWFFVSRTRVRRATGRWSPLVLLGTMTLLQAMNWFGPQPLASGQAAPPSTAILGLVAYISLAGVAWWTAATRVPRAINHGKGHLPSLQRRIVCNPRQRPHHARAPE